MQPCVNPNYFNQFPQFQNPYYERTHHALGKVVESVDMVRAIDIPMDGNMYFFPKADGTEVFSKRWLPNGTTEITSYKPQNCDFNASVSRMSTDDVKIDSRAFCEFTEAFEKGFSELKEQVEAISRVLTKTKTKKDGE